MNDSNFIIIVADYRFDTDTGEVFRRRSYGSMAHGWDRIGVVRRKPSLYGRLFGKPRPFRLSLKEALSMMQELHYRDTWSRILADNFEGWQTVELDLTPVNGDNGDWEKIKTISIRKHCTTRGKKDQVVSCLPPDWWRLIGDRVGNDLRHRLVTEDFMPQIDWKLYDHVSLRQGGGGIALADCRKALPTDSAR